MPPIKSFPVEKPVKEAYTIMFVLGGIIGPSAPEPAMREATNDL